ncbi:MAG: phosphate transport system regulatory protein PhoU [Lentisphaerae bacterium RIFOXYB12_FULL_65_16]|nr:MAG: phosphate transport system regulatory protein PhoU [Lentisphaerae bacterium RIFOXYA12_64_32]OGV93347.1 MAG: phosphate transport system regulatory protein PhoU [Lentisphaerae bacterium RIFOXYB12_FULL_65_16]
MQQDIERIRGKVIEMSSLGETALKTCLRALTERNRQLAYAVILRDRYIDEMEKDLDHQCLEFLVRQQPVAGPLRFAYATIKMDLELERVGDYAESIARQSLKLLDMDAQVPTKWLLEIGNRSIQMLHDATLAFAHQDAELAKATIACEPAVDLMKSQVNKELVRLFRENKLSFEALSPLMAIVRRFERVSDQARNICMEVLYMCTGDYVKHPGAEAVRILFVDVHNACRSQMAEAAGNSLGRPRFVFVSAGIEPQPSDARTVSFLAGKGIDASRMIPKGIGDIPHLDHHQVIVALADEVRHAFPRRPRKCVFMDWTVPDPSTVQGSPEEIHAAYEKTYAFILSHVRDLVAAVEGENL